MRTGTFNVRRGGDGHVVAIAAGGEARLDHEVAPLRVTPDTPVTYRVDDGERTWRVFVTGSGDRRQVFVNGEVYELEVGSDAGVAPRAGRAATSDLVTAPMPAKVLAILAQPGQAVRRGDVLIKLEAMKMELPLRAPSDGTVRQIACREGELVQPGVSLLEIS